VIRIPRIILLSVFLLFTACSDNPIDRGGSAVSSDAIRYDGLYRELHYMYLTNISNPLQYEYISDLLKSELAVHGGIISNDNFVNLVGSSVCSVSNGITNIIYEFANTNIIFLGANQKYIAYAEGQNKPLLVTDCNSNLVFSGSNLIVLDETANYGMDMRGAKNYQTYFKNGDSPEMFLLSLVNPEERGQYEQGSYYYNCSVINLESGTTNTNVGIGKISDIVGFSSDNRYLIYNHFNYKDDYCNYKENQGQLFFYDLDNNDKIMIGVSEIPDNVYITRVGTIIGVSSDFKSFYHLSGDSLMTTNFSYVSCWGYDISGYNL